MHERTINRWPAIWDMAQGLSGLALALFMWVHMFMVSSILLGKDAMYFVSRMFEGEPIFGRPYPLLVSGFAVLIFSLVVFHAFLAMRKFPSTYREYRALHRHTRSIKHPDTWLWVIQVITGFILFFLVLVHLYQLIFHPDNIGPYASSDRIWTGRFWPLYLALLFSVELHGAIGLYRLILKWGWFGVNQSKARRKRLKQAKWFITVFFLVLGLTTLAAYIKIGYEHSANAGERYTPNAGHLIAD